jgi:hypothetical protein
MKMTMQRAKKALAQNQLVRKMSREGNPEVHYKFFNEVYDSLAEIVNEDVMWEKRYRKLAAWADDAWKEIDIMTEVGEPDQELLDRLTLIKREVEE